MKKEFKKEMLQDIRFSIMRCLKYEEVAEIEEMDEDIIAALNNVKLFANVVIDKLDYYKKCLKEDNQHNETKEKSLS